MPQQGSMVFAGDIVAASAEISSLGKDGAAELFRLTEGDPFYLMLSMNLKRFSPAITLSVLIAASLLGSAQLQAGASNKSGNPFGNGSFFSDTGTFSAIVRGKNGFLGIVQFSTSPTNSASVISTGTNAATTGTGSTTTGVASVYAYGEQFTGTAYGTVSGSTLAATYLANYSYSLLLPNSTVTTLTNGQTQTNTAYVAQAVNDTVNGQIDATLYNSYPTQSFSGTGQATTIFTVVNQTNFTISGEEVTQTNQVTGTRLTQ